MIFTKGILEHYMGFNKCYPTSRKVSNAFEWRSWRAEKKGYGPPRELLPALHVGLLCQQKHMVLVT